MRGRLKATSLCLVPISISIKFMFIEKQGGGGNVWML